MHMGDLNTAPTFVAMIMKIHMEWYTLSKERGLKNVASQIIVDYVLLYGSTAMNILVCFRTVLDVLKRHHSTLKLKKCKWFQGRCEFIGMDVAAGVKQPAQSKNEAFSNLERPNTWGDLRILIGVFGLYTQFLPLYEIDIRPWRYILSKQNHPGTLSQKEDMELMHKLCNTYDQRLL